MRCCGLRGYQVRSSTPYSIPVGSMLYSVQPAFQCSNQHKKFEPLQKPRGSPFTEPRCMFACALHGDNHPSTPMATLRSSWAHVTLSPRLRTTGLLRSHARVGSGHWKDPAGSRRIVEKCFLSHLCKRYALIIYLNFDRAAYKTTISLHFPHGTMHYRLIYHI
jgi:hypothetical protein